MPFRAIGSPKNRPFKAQIDYRQLSIASFSNCLFQCLPSRRFQQSMERRCFTVTMTTPNIRCVKTFAAPLTITCLAP